MQLGQGIQGSWTIDKTCICVSPNSLDIKQRRGFGGKEPEVFQTNASLCGCLS